MDAFAAAGSLDCASVATPAPQELLPITTAEPSQLLARPLASTVAIELVH